MSVLALFVSPFKLVKILKQSTDPELNKPDPTFAWFSSEEGARAYREANSVMKKTLYFYDYLQIVSKRGNDKLTDFSLHRLAFVMAHRVAGSSLPYAKYPDILEEDKNPIVRAVKRFTMDDSATDHSLVSGLILWAMHQENTLEDWCMENHEPFQYLTPLAEDQSNRDQYLLEREIIFALNSKKKDVFDIGQYSYSIFSRREDDEEEDDKDGE